MRIKDYTPKIALAFVLVFSATSCFAQHNKDAKHEQKPGEHKSHNKEHFDEVNKRGDMAMGFSHQKTTHRFRLLETGGAIEVTINNADDKESLEQIRKHLKHISELFPAGNFEAPFLTHGKVPPGVEMMKESQGEISYKYEDMEKGGRVLISTANARALEAIYEFLRFQIEDHQTGDSTKVEVSKN